MSKGNQKIISVEYKELESHIITVIHIATACPLSLAAKLGLDQTGGALELKRT